MLPKNIHGAIFDLDGTLLDSLGAWRNVDYIFLSRRGISMPSDYPDAVSAMHFPQAADYTVARFSLDENPADIMQEWEELVREQYEREICLKPHAADVLHTLKAREIRLGIATSSRESLYLPPLKKAGVYELFDAVVHTEDVARGKAFPDVYLEAARRLHVSAQECAVFEDIAVGIRGAKAGGFFTVAVRDEHNPADQEALKTAADCYLTDFSQLTESSR